jgi:predicted double-glycine peptidase
MYRKLSTISDKSFLQIRIKIESFLQIETRQKLPVDWAWKKTMKQDKMNTLVDTQIGPNQF